MNALEDAGVEARFIFALDDDNHGIMGSVTKVKRPMVDSGAVTSACPRDYDPNAPTARYSRCLVGPGADSKSIGVYGARQCVGTVALSDGSKARSAIEYEVADIRRPILAVCKQMDDGKAVWFHPKLGCGVAPAECVRVNVEGPYARIERVGNLFELDFDLEPAPEGMVAPLREGARVAPEVRHKLDSWKKIS